MKYLENAKKIYDSYFSETPAPCTQEQVEHVEQFLHLKLPVAFVEYLLWMGQWADMMRGSDFFYWPLFDLREGAETLMAHTECQETLPQDAIVFFMHGGNQFMFIRTSEGDDPPVYFYGGKNPYFTKPFEHFSSCLEAIIQQEIRLTKELEVLRKE